MREKIEKNLMTFERKTITVDELETFFPDETDYKTFASTVLQLEESQILEMVKAQGRNSKSPSLAYRYRIHSYELKRTFYKILQTYRHKFHNAINLDVYFSSDPSVWHCDLPYLKKINEYIVNNGFPTEKVPAPERSFELVNDEKWIEKDGVNVLERIKLWEKLKIAPVSDPLMLAVNPRQMTVEPKIHLIVENKTTYQALLQVLSKSPFATLIYGSGNKIPGNIENFSDQYPVKGIHTFFYFGDIDHTGIEIWDRVAKQKNVIPAIPFYLACLEKEAVFGKTNQRPNKRALTNFFAHFSHDIEQKIRNLFAEGFYYPQEILKTKELQIIMLESNWDKYIV